MARGIGAVGGISIGILTLTTGRGETGVIAAATWSLGTHTSSKHRNERVHPSGAGLVTSQNHSPIE